MSLQKTKVILELAETLAKYLNDECNAISHEIDLLLDKQKNKAKMIKLIKEHLEDKSNIK
jgi:hypothetical protein